MKETPPRLQRPLASSLLLSLVLWLPGCAVPSGAGGGRAVDDDRLAARVEARFAEDPGIGALRVSVQAQAGRVVLSGHARSQAEKDKAGSLARGVADVKEVRNEIVVRPPG